MGSTSTSRIKATALGVLSAAAFTLPASAAQLFAASYDMPNGDGQASGGSFNYWDRDYTGLGLTTVDGAPLTDGLGDLTDGVIAPDIWLNTENVDGSGPYVGWYGPATLNPFITFRFGGIVTLNSISIHLDNSGQGGVFAPAAILVDGASQAFTAPVFGTAGIVQITGLALTGDTHTIQLQQAFDGTAWVFASEVSFFGDATAVPEPAGWALMLSGFGLAGAALRRRRTQAA